MWHRLYKEGSSLQGGTLLQLRNLINRRNVSAATVIKNHANEVQDFLEVVVRSHILAVAMHYFSMGNVDDVPQTSAFPADVATLPLPQKWKNFHDQLCQIVDRYVIPKQYLLNDNSVSSSLSVTSSTSFVNPHADRVEREHSYTIRPVVEHRQLPLTVARHSQRKKASESVKRIAEDGVFNYASAVLNDGLLLLELSDSTKEGDGKRINRCWKGMLVYFQFGHHYNYVKEAILLQAAVHATASPHLAAQITWSRTVNTKGGKGNNIPVDLHNEHLNRALKTAISSTGANVDPKTILQCGKSLKGLMSTVKNFDGEHGIHDVSTMHTRSSLIKDEKAILDELTKSRVFDYVPGREHSTFRGVTPNPAINLDKAKL